MTPLTTNDALVMFVALFLFNAVILSVVFCKCGEIHDAVKTITNRNSQKGKS